MKKRRDPIHVRILKPRPQAPQNDRWGANPILLFALLGALVSWGTYRLLAWILAAG